MKYPAGLSGDEYAAMEEGYEQGLTEGQRRAEKAAKPDTRILRGLTSAGAVALTVDGVAYIRQSDLIEAVK